MKFTSFLLALLNRDKKCICLITYKPNLIWLSFLNEFKSYDIFVIVDDNSIDYQKIYKTHYPNINFIQIANQECEDNGYVNVNFLMNKNVTGWEKALYFFSRKNNNYAKVWFIEDDVFFHSEKTLATIDKQFPDSDILSRNCMQREDCRSWKHWKDISINFNPPYFMSMVCATRISKNLLFYINQYAITHNTLFFLEALFPTLARKYRLLYDCPKELDSVVWRRVWKENEINSKNIYHPEKDINLHFYYRDTNAI